MCSSLNIFQRWPTPSSLRQTKQIHAQMVILGLQFHKLPLTHLLRSLNQEFRDLTYALTIFHQIPRPSTFLYNTIIHVCNDHHNPTESIRLYTQMRQSGAIPDAYTFRCLFKACVISSFVSEGRALHGCFFKYFDECCYSVGTSSLIHMYSGFGLLGDARRVFDRIISKDVVLWTTMVGGYAKSGHMADAQNLFGEMPTRNVVSWTSMITGYSQSEQPSEALKCFRDMVTTGVIPDSVSMISTLSACAQLKDLEMGKWIHDFVVREGISITKNLIVALVDMYIKCGDVESAREVFEAIGWKIRAAWNSLIDGFCKFGDLDTAQSLFDQMEDRDCISFNSLITGYVHSGRLKEALVLFVELRECGLQPDSFTMAGLLTVCANLGALNQGKVLHSLIVVDNLIKPDIYIRTTLLDMYAKCGRIDQALLVFNRMDKKDALAWSAIISGLAMNGDGNLALQYFSLMREEGIRPNAVAYVGVLNACSHSGLLEEGYKHFKEMKSVYNIAPEIEHYGCMVDLLGRCGFLRDAEALINDMPMKPNVIIWNSLLSACKIHKAIEVAEKVAKNILIMEPHNNSVYVQLYNIYISFGRWKDASEVRQEMEKRGIKKTIGWSSIVISGQLHKFSAGGQSHPDILEIQKFLFEMANRLKQAGYIPISSKIVENMEEEEKDQFFFGHSERIAVAYGIMKLGANMPIHVLKNLRICEDCHLTFKWISKIWDREIVIRDRSRFHHFRDGFCSCKEFW